jgi:ABC-2 type transport system ATP-binding protein
VPTSPPPAPAPAGTTALAVASLRHRYGERIALHDLTFSVARGEIFGLLGPNGGGKTTLFRILSTLLSPTAGQVLVFGDSARERPEVVRRHLGVVFQSPALDDRLTVAENLRHHGHLYGLSGRALADRATAVLEALSLAPRRGDLVGSLSGGLKRRVEVAKALMPEPRLLLLDEPSTGLDPRARRELWDQIVALRDRTGATVVLTTHLMEEAGGCDRVGILHEGRLVALGTPADLTAAVGGDVLWVTPAGDGAAPSPSHAASAGHDVTAPTALRPPGGAAALAADISARFGVRADVVDGRVRMERARAHEFIAALIEAFPGRIDAVTMTRPTLEDVFVHHTGTLFV